MVRVADCLSLSSQKINATLFSISNTFFRFGLRRLNIFRGAFMKRHVQAKRQNLPLILMIILTVSLAGVAFFLIFGKDLIFNRTVDSPASSPTSTSTALATNSETASESSSEPTAPKEPTPVVIETDPAKLLLPVTDLPGYFAPTANSGGSFSKTFSTDNGTYTW